MAKFNLGEKIRIGEYELDDLEGRLKNVFGGDMTKQHLALKIVAELSYCGCMKVGDLKERMHNTRLFVPSLRRDGKFEMEKMPGVVKVDIGGEVKIKKLKKNCVDAKIGDDLFFEVLGALFGLKIAFVVANALPKYLFAPPVK